jgi:hypothetical protein
MKNRAAISLFMVVLTALACTLSPTGGPTEPTLAPTQPPVPTPVPTPASQPVSISEGLASLNSYKTVLSITTSGPDPSNSSSLEFETQRSNDNAAQYTHFTSKSIEDGQPSEGDSDTEIYRIGDDQCSGSEEDWSYTSMAANQAEMMDTVMSMFSFSPLTADPVFVAEETVNGISTNHFSFKIKGLGVKSGANVTINQGDYWLAVDGQYLVKYDLVAETVMDPQTNVMHMETQFEVNEINQPIAIAFPQGCLDAAQATPSDDSP